jgi:carbon monoxide dehydrogenase subunit G
MAMIIRDTAIAVPAAAVWDAVRDVGALHTRLVPGFVRDVTMAPDATPPVRVVTFASGTVLHETIVAVDDDRRRLVWAIRGDGVAHHNGAITVADDGAGGARVEWTADVLPDALAAPFAGFMDTGLATMKAHLEAAR